jgi:hypothetical protein
MQSVESVVDQRQVILRWMHEAQDLGGMRRARRKSERRETRAGAVPWEREDVVQDGAGAAVG